METRQIYCTACDRSVAILLTDGAGHETQAAILDPELLCLDADGDCAALVCPMTAMTPSAMAVRLAKSGQQTNRRHVYRGACDGCDRETELVLTVGGYLTCVECGATRRVTEMRAPSGSELNAALDLED